MHRASPDERTARLWGDNEHRCGKGRPSGALQGADLVFVLGGLGEGMKPEGAATAVCEMAGRLGRTSVAIFTVRPESREDEEGRRPGGSLSGGLADAADTVILLDGGRVLQAASGPRGGRRSPR